MTLMEHESNKNNPNNIHGFHSSFPSDEAPIHMPELPRIDSSFTANGTKVLTLENMEHIPNFDPTKSFKVTIKQNKK